MALTCQLKLLTLKGDNGFEMWEGIKLGLQEVIKLEHHIKSLTSVNIRSLHARFTNVLLLG